MLNLLRLFGHTVAYAGDFILRFRLPYKKYGHTNVEKTDIDPNFLIFKKSQLSLLL